jgi:DNA-binding response OmpR family regulator
MVTLLCIDDTAADVELLRILLERRNIRVEAAHTGASGIAAYNSLRHAAAVIDWNLPDMEGIDVARALLARHPRCRCAFLSGRFKEEHIAAAAAIGIPHCFEKSLDMMHIERIASLVEAYEAIRQAV